MRRGLFLIMLDEDEAIPESEFNDWYDNVHIPERLACPGVLSARRFEAVDGSPRYLTLYELESLDALASPEWKARTTIENENGTDLDRRMMTGHRNVVKNVYRELE